MQVVAKAKELETELSVVRRSGQVEQQKLSADAERRVAAAESAKERLERRAEADRKEAAEKAAAMKEETKEAQAVAEAQTAAARKELSSTVREASAQEVKAKADAQAASVAARQAEQHRMGLEADLGSARGSITEYEVNLAELVARETKVLERKDELTEALREATQTKDMAVLESESVRAEWTGYAEKLHEAQITVRNLQRACLLLLGSTGPDR